VSSRDEPQPCARYAHRARRRPASTTASSRRSAPVFLDRRDEHRAALVVQAVRGSSSSTSAGRCRKVIAIRTRWRCPIDMRSMRRPASASSSKRSIDSSTSSASLAHGHEREARPVIEVLANRHPRVETGVARGQEADALLVGAPRALRLEAAQRRAPVGAMMPATIRSSVVFPAPFSPVSQTSSPAGSSRSMSRSTGLVLARPALRHRADK
jgi:hypothetical protein